MVWGILRIVVFGVAFLIGGLIAGAWGLSVSAGSVNRDAEDLTNTGASLLVRCTEGDPAVHHVSGSAAVEVKCSNSRMQVIHTEPQPLPDNEPDNMPSSPIAALETGRIDH